MHFPLSGSPKHKGLYDCFFSVIKKQPFAAFCRIPVKIGKMLINSYIFNNLSYYYWERRSFPWPLVYIYIPLTTLNWYTFGNATYLLTLLLYQLNFIIHLWHSTPASSEGYSKFQPMQPWCLLFVRPKEVVLTLRCALFTSRLRHGLQKGGILLISFSSGDI